MSPYETRQARRAITYMIVAALMGSAPTRVAFAQESSDRALGENLFPPELVMQNQQKLGLRPEQRATITQAIQQLQTRVVELQWRMQDEAQQLADILKSNTVDESEALAQIDRVLAVEREVKRAHIAMLIRIKNVLTPEQQATLKALR